MAESQSDYDVRRRLALALAMQGTDVSPVGHWTQGAARVANAILGNYELGALDKADVAEREMFANSLPGLGGTSAPRGSSLANAIAPAAPMPRPATPRPPAQRQSGLAFPDRVYSQNELSPLDAQVSTPQELAAASNMRPQDFDRTVRTVVGEADGEPPIGRQAVANVIVNRANMAGKTPSDVITPSQFEPWQTPAGRRRMSVPQGSDSYRNAALATYAATQADPTGGATHFYSPGEQARLPSPTGGRRSKPSWDDGTGEMIGTQAYFRLPFAGKQPPVPGAPAPMPDQEPGQAMALTAPDALPPGLPADLPPQITSPGQPQQMAQAQARTPLPTPRPAPPQAPAPQAAQPQPQQSAPRPQRGGVDLPQDVADTVKRALLSSNPKIRDWGKQLYLQFAKPTDRWTDVTDAQGNITGQRSSLSNKLEKVPEPPDAIQITREMYANPRAYGFAGPDDPALHEAARKRLSGQSTSVSLSTVANPVLEGVAKQVVDLRKEAQAAVTTIPQIHDARRALHEGIVAGQFADSRLAFKKIGALFGYDDPSIANTEVFRSVIGNEVLSQIKALGANPSNTDRIFIEKIMGGDIALEPQSLERILGISEKYARIKIKQFNSDAQKLIKAAPDQYRGIEALMNYEEPPEYVRPAAPAPGLTPADVDAEIKRRNPPQQPPR